MERRAHVGDATRLVPLDWIRSSPLPAHPFTHPPTNATPQVAVIFDKDDDNDESDDSGDDIDVVRDDDMVEEEQGEDTAMDAEVTANLGDIEGVVDSDQVDPQKIDAFWLQRE